MHIAMFLAFLISTSWSGQTDLFTKLLDPTTQGACTLQSCSDSFSTVLKSYQSDLTLADQGFFEGLQKTPPGLEGPPEVTRQECMKIAPAVYQKGFEQGKSGQRFLFGPHSFFEDEGTKNKACVEFDKKAAEDRCCLAGYLSGDSVLAVAVQKQNSSPSCKIEFDAGIAAASSHSGGECNSTELELSPLPGCWSAGFRQKYELRSTTDPTSNDTWAATTDQIYKTTPESAAPNQNPSTSGGTEAAK